MRKTIYILTLLTFSITSFSQIPQKHLDHSVYDKWNIIQNISISDDGKWVCYVVSSQKDGLDSWLYLYDVESGKLDSIQRGENAKFSPNSNFLVFKIKPQYDTIRQKKLAKIKKDELPKDSLGIWVFGRDSIIKIANIKNFDLAEEASDWLVYHLDKEPKEKPKKKEEIKEETKEEVELSEEEKSIAEKKEKEEKAKAKKESKQIGTHLVIMNPITMDQYKFLNVDEFEMANYGGLVVFKSIIKDNDVDTSSVFIFDPTEKKSEKIFETTGELKKIALDSNGRQICFLLSEDTTENKIYQLNYWNKKDGIKMLVDTKSKGMVDGYCVSENYSPWFSKDGSMIYLGFANKPEDKPKDTLLDEEKVAVDIWNWKDLELQPEQLNSLKRDQKKSQISVYHIKKNEFVVLGNEKFSRVSIYNNGDAQYAMGYSNLKYKRAYTWDPERMFDAYLIDVNTGESELLLEGESSSINISPDQKWLYWYSNADSSWFAMDLKKRVRHNLTHKLPINFYQEEYDIPAYPYPYGIAGWDEHDKFIYIYDRYDIWKIDPTQKSDPINITNSYGRNHKIRFRYIQLNRDEKYFKPNQKLLLKAFDENDKTEGYFAASINKAQDPTQLIKAPKSFIDPVKSKKSSVIVWRMMDYQKYPDLQLSKTDFKNPKQISFANPQQKEYIWGSVELVKWVDFDGIEREGLLYYPGNFDSRKKYPMIVYYYEKNSEELYNYLSPKPSYSVISYPMYTSNGYFIFVPDIYYKTGQPGKSAYDAIMSGTLAMCEKPFIDKNNVGLQGQSWGGYQTAYLVTQTNFFKAAMGGAVVSNMTSAYGGIRWGSGVSRMFQYEGGQSRIGANLWEARELYIENSPIFFADRVETPLLLMHNDNDGAVPWYQGIEYFGALRRLNKEVWMLVYNGEEHNLTKWPNRVDLSIRMMQFFDYYLKDEPIPKWMEEGLPALEKGKTLGYELKN